jgi:hypothetical protein
MLSPYVSCILLNALWLNDSDNFENSSNASTTVTLSQMLIIICHSHLKVFILHKARYLTLSRTRLRSTSMLFE